MESGESRADAGIDPRLGSMIVREPSDFGGRWTGGSWVDQGIQKHVLMLYIYTHMLVMIYG